jgi:hypothetical protein
METMLKDTRAFLDDRTMPFEHYTGPEKHFVLRVTRAYRDPAGQELHALALVFVTEHPEEIDTLLEKNGGPLRT